MGMAMDRGDPLRLPDLGGFHYMAEAMMRLGPIRAGAMDNRPADWPEIEAFARLTGRISAPWEAQAIFDMCAAYLRELREGADSLTVAPVDRE